MKNIFEEKYTLLEDVISKWNELYTIENEEYTNALRKQGVENLSSLNKELANKRNQRDQIENIEKPRYNTLFKEREDLYTKRKKLVNELQSIWTEIREARKFAIKTMNKRLSNDVIIKLSDNVNLDAYFNALNDFLPGSIQSRDKQIQKVIEIIKPGDLVNYINSGNTQKISSLTGITINTANKFTQIPEINLMQLERTRCDDIVEIKLLLEKKEKSLADLSEGERCTAILSVILLDESSPLIIDQPEDELDHAFIMTNVVETLARVKQKIDPLDKDFIPKRGRQFIIATHNQNIPVLGDAELVFKMRKIPGENRCESECANGLEHPDTIKYILSLEGGKSAFDRRRQKYGEQ